MFTKINPPKNGSTNWKLSYPNILTSVFYLTGTLFAIIAIILLAQHVKQPFAETTLNLTPNASQTILNNVSDIPNTLNLKPTGNDGLTVNVQAFETIPNEPNPCLELGPTSGISIMCDTYSKIRENSIPVPYWLRILTGLPTTIWLAGLAVIALLLGRTLHSIAVGQPFAVKQARRWTWISVAILIASVGADTINLIAAHAFINHYTTTPTPLNVVAYYGFIPPAIAVITFVLAGVFRSGQHIQEDVAGLI